MSKLVNPTSCTNEKKRGSGIRDGRTIVSSHYVVVAERLTCICAAAFATADGNKTKMADGERGGGCDAGKGVCEHAVRHARSPLGDRPMPTRTSPAPSTTRKCMPCTLLYNEPFWLEQAAEKKRLCVLLHKYSRNTFYTSLNSRFLTIEISFKSNEHSQEATIQVSRVTQKPLFPWTSEEETVSIRIPELPNILNML